MNYTDYGSTLGKNSSNSTGKNQNESQVNFDSSFSDRPNGNGAYSRYNSGTPQRETNKINAYSNYDAYRKDSNFTNGNPKARSDSYGQDTYRNGSAPARDSNSNGGANRYRSSYETGSKQNGAYAGSSGSASKSKPQNGYESGGNGAKTSGTKVKSTGADGSRTKVASYSNSNGASNGNGKGNGSKLKKQQNLTFQQKFMAWLKRFLRSVYLMGKPMRIFIASAVGFVLICVVLIFAISGTRHKKAETMAAQIALMTTPSPTIEATATPVPTPSPTPEIRIEKGAEGEDVMTLQKRLMELGYLAIDEPTSYFGNATKYAVKLFQRQHELQQDGICGNETIALLYSEDAKKYVMTEGAEGDDIESFQEQLVELGYLDSSQVTGYYGTDTVEAVKKFQNRNYITKDGKAGEQTLEEINSADARVSYTKEKEIEAEKKKQAALARASSAAGRIEKMISIAKKQLGDTYVLGKSGPDSFDCSGLVYYCLRQVNVYTRRLNAAGLSKTSSWKMISDIDDVKAGDLLFFKSDESSTVGHVGIYIGGGEMIDASSANGKVVRRGAKTSYWRRNFVVARRPIV